MSRKQRQSSTQIEDSNIKNDIFSEESENIIEPKLEDESNIIIENIKKPIYKVKVNHPALRIRTAPSLQANPIDLITDQGIYEIFDEVNGWGQLENDNWIMLAYTTKLF